MMTQKKVYDIVVNFKTNEMTEFKPKVYIVPSDSDPNREYLVTQYRPGMWRCSCRDYAFRSKTPDGYAKDPPYRCKHIKGKIRQLKKEGKITTRL